jgi:SpoVK/Ycf46/Vps4 family AAA+-type ATPase
MKTILNHHSAGFPLLWIPTTEPSRLKAEVRRARDHARENSEPGGDANLFSWDLLRGITNLDTQDSISADPAGVWPMLAEQIPSPSITFLDLSYKYLDNPEVLQSALNALDRMKQIGAMAICPALTPRMPPELSKLAKVIDFELPSPGELAACLQEVARNAELDPLPQEELDTLAQAARGLTLAEAENAAALCVVTLGRLDYQVILDSKLQIIRESTSLQVGHFSERLEDVYGLDEVTRTIRECAPSQYARGIILLGIPGTGKSHISKAAGNYLHRPTVIMDAGRIMAAGGGLVGGAERAIDDALRTVRAIGPCVLMLDELEKMLQGSTGYSGDGGAKASVGGGLLKFLSDRPDNDQIYVMATCNSLDGLPGEFTRAGRWDGIFFVDLPDAETRGRILDHYRRKYGLDPADTLTPEQTLDYTGAELEALCKQSAMRGRPLADCKKYITQVIKTHGSQLARLRQEAQAMTNAADKTEPQAATPSRKIAKPQVN